MVSNNHKKVYKQCRQQTLTMKGLHVLQMIDSSYKRFTSNWGSSFKSIDDDMYMMVIVVGRQVDNKQVLLSCVFIFSYSFFYSSTFFFDGNQVVKFHGLILFFLIVNMDRTYSNLDQIVENLGWSSLKQSHISIILPLMSKV